MNDELISKVKQYLKITEQGNAAKQFPLDTQGFWRITCAAEDSHGLRERYQRKEIIQGSFVNAIAYAVQQRNFFYQDLPNYDSTSIYHGYVEKVDVLMPTFVGLVELVNSSEIHSASKK